MRTDMDKLICERERIHSTELSHKTGLKVPLTADFEDFDDGCPRRLPMSRRRQEYEGIYNKSFNENLNPLKRYLYASIGRPWDDVYSEIRANIDTRKAIGLHVMQHLWQYVERFVEIVNGVPFESHGRYGRVMEVDGLYIHPETGLLSYKDRARYSKPPKEVTQLHWYDGFWFELLKFKKSVCHCTSEKYVPPEKVRYRKSWREVYNAGDGPKVCQHNNPLIERKIWYVVEYAYHDPMEVVEVYKYETCSEYYRTIYGLKEPGDQHVIRYKDRPDLMAKSYEVRRKVANRKELKVIARALEERPA